MRGLLHIAVAVPLLGLGLVACGNLENAPFLVGTVRGQLTESNPDVALVSLVGQPGVRSLVDGEGHFTLERVPVGAVELFIVATADKALRMPVTVRGGQVVDVSAVAPKPAGFFEMRVKAAHGVKVDSAQVSVEGTPFQRLVLDPSGKARVGPLPDGCYAVTVSAPGFPDFETERCVGSGEKQEVAMVLEWEDGSRACAVSGCNEGLTCSPLGRCVECFEDAQCGVGFTCSDSRCEGPGALCAPCAGDWQCQAGASCQTLPEGSAACVTSCDKGEACDSGFTCQGGRCLPDAARIGSCQALRGIGTPCDGDARCREQGLADGLCIDGACTVSCVSERECPGVSRCEDSTFGRFCQRLR